MTKNIYKNIISLTLIIALTAGAFGSLTYFEADKSYAQTDDAVITADVNKNSINFPASMRRGTFFTVTVDGDRYADVYSKYNQYINGTATKSAFSQNEEFFEPADITVKSVKVAGSKVNNKYSYIHDSFGFPHERYGLNQRLNAGKYTVTANFVKRAVSVPSSADTVFYYAKDQTLYSKTATFYVESKVTLKYNKKYGKLAKKNRTLYKKPGLKYGKLPTPKAKKGYKFIGWYTKSSGGKKVKKTTKAPTQNNIILYARYVKK